jgi:hypothetical protein
MTASLYRDAVLVLRVGSESDQVVASELEVDLD